MMNSNHNNGFQNSVTKEVVRQLLVSRIVETYDTEKPLSLLTLPGDSLSFERSIARQYDAPVMVGVEKDKTVYESALQKAAQYKLPIEIYNLMDDSYLDKHKHMFHVAWLDYCGGWGQGKLDSIAELVFGDHLIFSEGTKPLLGLTISDGMDLKGISQLRELTWKLFKTADERDQNYIARIFGVPRAINNVLAEGGCTAVPKLIVRYIDHVRAKKTVPMLFFLFEVERDLVKYKEDKSIILEMVSDYAGSILQ